MSSQGPSYPSTATDDNTDGSGYVAWTNVGNAKASDDSRATVTVTGFSGGNPFSHYIKTVGYGFSIPAGATIDGIAVGVEGFTGSTFTNFVAAFLVKAGTIVTGQQTGSFTTSEGFITLGSSSSLWGNAWSASDINDANFGCAVQFQCNQFSGSGFVGNIDSIRITVYYTPASGGMVVDRRSRRVRNLLRM